MTHIDEWLEDIPQKPDNGEIYARWVIEYFRLPAWKKDLYWQFMKEHKLFCTYNKKRYRMTGASRLGDVFLVRDPNREIGYDMRVAIDDCSNFRATP